MISGADLDHVALASESRATLERRYADQLGGRPLAEGPSPGFVWAQLEYSNGMVLEMLEPYRVEENDFLRRFLDRNGPGPHHLTFKVSDFRAALAEAAAAGYTPVNVNESDPNWKEAFLHPRDAPGVVVQLAESHEHYEQPAADPSVRRAELVHVAHAVRDIHDGLRLLEGLLGGVRTGTGSADGHRWIDLAWPGPGRVRLIEPDAGSDADGWIGPRPGRVHHLAFRLPDPASVPDVVVHDQGWAIEPDHNQGTRILFV